MVRFLFNFPNYAWYSGMRYNAGRLWQTPDAILLYVIGIHSFHFKCNKNLVEFSTCRFEARIKVYISQGILQPFCTTYLHNREYKIKISLTSIYHMENLNSSPLVP